MSGFNTPQAQGASQHPKQMSSRLLTMKFMQRASASTSKPTSPATLNSISSEPFSKKRKLDSHLSPSAAPRVQTPGSTERSFLAAHQNDTSPAGPLAVGLKEGGETQWVLDHAIPTTHNHEVEEEETQEEDSTDENQIWSNRATGRQTYGNFKRRKHQSKPSDETVANDEDLSSLSGSDTSSDSDSLESNSDRNHQHTPNPSKSLLNKHDPKKNRHQNHDRKRKPNKSDSSPIHQKLGGGGHGHGQPGSLRELANRAEARAQSRNGTNHSGKKKKSRKTI